MEYSPPDRCNLAANRDAQIRKDPASFSDRSQSTEEVLYVVGRESLISWEMHLDLVSQLYDFEGVGHNLT